MTKQSIDRKAVRQHIVEGLAAGKTKETLLDELSEEYFERDTLAKMIAGTVNRPVTPSDRVLAYLILASVIGLTITVFLTRGWNAIGLDILLVFVAIKIVSFEGAMFRILSLLCLTSILGVIFLPEISLTAMIIDIATRVCIAGLSYTLAQKYFPHMGLLGPKKDTSGNIILE